jgi:hypothetical protein
VPREDQPKPVIFHDGRIVQKLSPVLALLIVLWIPIGFMLSCIRIAAGSLLPMRMVYHARRRWPAVRLDRPACSSSAPTTLSSIPSSSPPRWYRLSEFLSPIRMVRLTRDRAAAATAGHRFRPAAATREKAGSWEGGDGHGGGEGDDEGWGEKREDKVEGVARAVEASAVKKIPRN